MGWGNLQDIGPREYTCGHCDRLVASRQGWYNPDHGTSRIYICPNCSAPSHFSGHGQIPGFRTGETVRNLPQDIAAIYEEARASAASNCHTGAVLLARKLLMHIAVAQGAAPGLKFIEYVEHLAAAGFVPPNGKAWVDHIRQKGNEATHELVLMGSTESEELITFVEMLLKFVYEFPSRVPTSAKKGAP
ncbi:MAG: DUF4145 domain-containing protein [Gemmatimonadales bacterium]|nr:DUF4145 domain-containing protein [Gemmatimonadales bacterium]